MDLVTELLQCREHNYTLLERAADEIERLQDRIAALEDALRELSDDWDCCNVSKAMREIARAALKGGDNV